jgi:hypothetical protein
MQGKWKEKLGGYDLKGNRRKKQSRKHTIKDKYNYFENRYYREGNSKFISNGLPEAVYEEKTVVKNGCWLDIVSLSDESSALKWEGKTSTRIVYMRKELWKVTFYDYIDLSILDVSFREKVNQYLGKEFFLFEIPEVTVVKNLVSGTNYNRSNIYYIYGKPVLKKWWGRGISKRYYKQTINSKNRAKVKEWISHENWDKICDTLDKNIVRWELY